jgi:hypothetical protein
VNTSLLAFFMVQVSRIVLMSPDAIEKQWETEKWAAKEAQEQKEAVQKHAQAVQGIEFARALFNFQCDVALEKITNSARSK